MKKEYQPQKRIKFKEYKNDPNAVTAIKELQDAMDLNAISGESAGPTLDKVRIAIYKAAERGIPIFNFENKDGKTPREIAEQRVAERIFAEAYRTIAGDLDQINKIYNNPLMERSLQRLARALERNVRLEQVFLFHNGPLLSKNSKAM